MGCTYSCFYWKSITQQQVYEKTIKKTQIQQIKNMQITEDSQKAWKRAKKGKIHRWRWFSKP